ncbi:MAG: FMN-binding glutamate synthase family protein, partial [Firmicutes bacterium]|nr:FMN-binding glutamate synthase family protein [Bacillota bacterium]
MFWSMFFGSLAAMGVLGCGLLLFARRIADHLLDGLSGRLLSDPYHENLLETVNVTAKIGPMNLAELELRTASGLPLARPFGSRKVFSPWNRFFFRPVYLTRPPLGTEEEVKTEVVIGPRAARPLRLEIPVLLGGMGWGIALSARAKLALAKGATLAGTAANTGGGPFLPVERAAAAKLIVQLNRAAWLREETYLRQADAVEVALGHGANGAAPSLIPAEDLAVDPEFRRALGRAKPGIEG